MLEATFFLLCTDLHPTACLLEVTLLLLHFLKFLQVQLLLSALICHRTRRSGQSSRRNLLTVQLKLFLFVLVSYQRMCRRTGSDNKFARKRRMLALEYDGRLYFYLSLAG